MQIRSKRSRRAAGAMIGAAIASLAASFGANSAIGAMPASWLNAANGTWNIAANWSTPNFPNNGSPGAADTYDALIGATGATYVVTLNSSITVNSLTLNAASVTLDQGSGVLSATNGIAIQAGVFRLGGAILGGTVSTSGDGRVIANGGTLDGVTLNGEADVGQQQPASLYINHDSTINGTVLAGNPSNANNGVVYFGAGAVANQTISGTANVLLGSSSDNTLYNYNQGTLTLNPGVTIHGQRGSIVNAYASGLIINQGTISADVAGGLIAVGNGLGTFSNSGTLETKNGSTLTLGGPWSNSGTITVNNSTLNLGGTFNTAGVGTINRTGGTVNITGTLNNTITGPLNLNASSGAWTLQGAILGGTVNTTGGSTIIGGGGTFDGVTLNGEADVGQQQQANLYFNHDSTINGAVMVGNPSNSNNGNLYFGGTAAVNQTISGTANVLLGASSNNNVYNYNQGTLTLNPGVTIHGQRGSIVNAYISGKIINQGTISADVAGGLIAIGNGLGTFSNSGTLETKNGSTLTLGGPWSNSGTITVNNSTLNLGGTFNTAGIGTINRTGGTVNITGTLDNSATGPLNINASGGSWTLLGAILGGTVNTTGGSTIIGGGGTLDGVTLNGEADVGQQQQASLYINHDSTINGTVMVGNPSNSNNGNLYFGTGAVANQTISGTANVLLGASRDNRLYNFNQGTLTLGPAVTIHGQQGSLVNLYPGGQTINQGAISADVAGGLIAIGNGNGTFSNTGTLETKNGSTLTLSGPWSNTGIITVNNSTLNLGGNFTTAGLGTINRVGGTINITGTLDNTTTGPLNFNATTGLWPLQSGGGIVGGTVNTTGGTAVIAAGGTLDGVTLNGEVDVGQQQPSSLFFNHDSTINGTVLVGNLTTPYVGAVYFGASAAANQTISGTANILLGNANNVLYNYNQGMLTLGPGVTIHGQNGSLVNIFGSGQIVNQGSISADVAGGLIAVDNGNGTFTNTGTLATKNGATLTVYSPALTNLSGSALTGGHYYAFAGSTINFGAAALATNAADIRLDGLSSHFDAINSLATNNGTFTVANGREFDIVPTTFVNNGALNAAAGGTIVIPGPTNSLAGGTNNGTINCSTGGTIIFNGSFLHAANSFLNGAGSVIFNGGTQTFNGTLIGDFDLTIAGAANFGPLSKTTTKTLNVQSGNTLVAAGAQLNIGTTALPGQVTFSGTTSPTIALTAGSAAAALVLGNSNISVANTGGIAQILTAGSGAQDGQFDLGGQTRTITFNANRTLLITAQVIHGGILTSGAGILELSNSNTYAGGSTITTGTLQVTDLNALGTGSVSFSDGTLDVRSDATIATIPNALAVTGPTHSMWLHVDRVTSGSPNTYVLNSATLGSNLTLTGTGTAQLGVATLTHDLTVDNFIPLNITGPISGTGSLTRDSSTGAAGTLTMSGSTNNTYTGTTIINGGAMVLNKSAGVTAVPHDLQILGGTVKSLASDQIADGANVSISNGSLELDGAHESIGTITIPAGGILAGATELAATMINNQAGAVNMTSNAIIENNAGGSTFNNAGTVNKFDAGNLIIRDIAGGTLTFTNTGTLNVSAGSTTISTSAFFNMGTINAQGSLVALTSPLIFNGGTIQTTGGGIVRFNNAFTTFTTSARINLASGGAIYDYTTSDPLMLVASQVKSGFANGAWNAPGIDSSGAAAASAGAHPTAVGFAEASAIGIHGTGTFLNQMVDDTTVLLRYTYSGDADLDGTVNSSDFARLAANFGEAGKSWSDGDYNYDGTVNALDFNALATNYGQIIGSSADLPDVGAAQFDARSLALGVTVPEPVGCFFFAGVAMLGRRTSRKSRCGFSR